MKKIAFIINPISGTKKGKSNLPALIQKTLDLEQWMPECVFTERPGHARELARTYVSLRYDAVVSVGGDGTLNEVASGLRDSDTALGIIPLGSGNGFARHLNIPISPAKAIAQFNHSEVISCDYGLANDHFFISTCGTGFDAVIADHFAGSTKRGFATYLNNILKDAFTYRPQHIRIVGDGIELEKKAFLVNFANASQYGYGAAIAPQSSIQDGLIDVSVMSEQAPLGAVDLAMRLFTKNINQSIWMQTFHAKEVTLIRDSELPFHIDGDPVRIGKDITVRVVEDGMKLLVAKRF